jgi:hypothetical protein
MTIKHNIEETPRKHNSEGRSGGVGLRVDVLLGPRPPITAVQLITELIAEPSFHYVFKD